MPRQQAKPAELFCPFGRGIMIFERNILPPTINQENPDPQCDLDYIPNTARTMDIKVALSNSFGFGGTNGTLVFRSV